MVRRYRYSSSALSPRDLFKGIPLIVLMALIIVSQSVMVWMIKRTTMHIKPIERHLQSDSNSSVLVLAAVPRDAKHLAALWTIMECLTVGFDLVLISSPLESRPVMELFVQKVREQDLHPNIQTMYAENDRYDVGLWCDALEYLTLNEYKYFVLLNDSVFAMRRFRAILDFLQSDRFHLVGFSYSHLGGYWVESFFRGFSLDGVQRFRQHSCFATPLDSSYQSKRRIVNYHEIQLTTLFEPNERTGLFSADVPELYPTERGWRNKTWVDSDNIRYWREILVNKHRFPVGKVKMPKMFNLTSSIHGLCMKKNHHSYFLDVFGGEDPTYEDDAVRIEKMTTNVTS